MLLKSEDGLTEKYVSSLDSRRIRVDENWTTAATALLLPGQPPPLPRVAQTVEREREEKEKKSRNSAAIIAKAEAA